MNNLQQQDTSTSGAGFTAQELLRYQRHFILPGFGAGAQEKLKSARVLVVGAGGLGSPALLYLAAAGVGTLGLIDFDVVEESNLQRQVLYDINHLGSLKVQAARERLHALNPYIRLQTHNHQLRPEHALNIFSGYDVIVDGSDNFATRYLVNDACVAAGKPLVYGSVFQFEGQVAVFNAERPDGSRGPNYRDLYPEPPAQGSVPSCVEGGVLGVLPGIIGSMQALEAIKLVAGIGAPLDGRFYIFDALQFESRTIRIRHNPDNPLTHHPAGKLLYTDYEAYCAERIAPAKVKEITAGDLIRLYQKGEDVQVIDVREPEEYAAGNIGGISIPLSTLLQRAAQIKRSGMVVVHCKSGARSIRAILDLQKELGLSNLYNLKGGLDAYLQQEKMNDQNSQDL